MQCSQSLIPFITNQKDVICNMDCTTPEQFKIVNRALCLGNADDFTRRTIDDELILYRMALLLAGV